MRAPSMWAATGPARIRARTRLVLILPPIPLRCATRRAAAKDLRAARCRPPGGWWERRVFTSSQRLYPPARNVPNRAATVRERLHLPNRQEAVHVYRMWHSAGEIGRASCRERVEISGVAG